MVSLSLVRFPIVRDAVGGWRELTLSDTLQGLFWSHFTVKREDSLNWQQATDSCSKASATGKLGKVCRLRRQLSKEIPSCAK